MMRHLPFPFLLAGIATFAPPAGADHNAKAPAGPNVISPSAGVASVQPGHIIEARLAPVHWYIAEQMSAAFQVAGSGPACTAQAVFSRREDGKKTTVPFGSIQLPWDGRAMVGDPLGLGPGTYDALINGVAGVTPACGGSASLGKVVADAALLGHNFPTITGAHWVGGDTYKAGSTADKYLEVNVVNYLDGSRWTKPSSWIKNPACAVTIDSNYSITDIHGQVHEMNVHWKDPYALVIAGEGGMPSYGQVLTPGPGGAPWRANIPKSIRHYQQFTAGETWTITIASTPTNNGMGESPCIGSAVAKLKID